jgi:hypothetical protein
VTIDPSPPARTSRYARANPTDRTEGTAVRRAASTSARHAALALGLLACVACTGTAASADANASPVPTGPIWTAPPSGLAARPTLTPTPSATTEPDAATGIELTGTYHLVYRASDTDLTQAFTAGLATSGLKPRAAAREVWDVSQHVGGMVVVDLVGMDLSDDALTTFVTTFASQSGADLTWTTVSDRRVAIVSDADRRLELFLLDGDLVVVAGVQPGIADDITQSLIDQNT